MSINHAGRVWPYEVTVKFGEVEFDKHVKLVAQYLKSGEFLIKELLKVVLSDQSYQSPERFFLRQDYSMLKKEQTYQ